MKGEKGMNKKLIVLLTLTLTFGLCGIGSAALITTANDAGILDGSDSFTVTAVGQQFPAAETIGGGVIEFAWNPAILQLDVVTPDPAFDGFFGDPGTIDNGNGTLTGFSVTGLSGPTGPDFDIVALTFTVLGTGSTSLQIFPDNASDTWNVVGVGPVTVDGVEGIIAADLTAGTYDVVSTVPIPGSILLLGSGLVGLIGFARRKMS
jgi:hypothetical protein